jgi:uncharacterized protein (TIGR01589 family)
MSGAGATSAAATPPVSTALPAEGPAADGAVPAESRRVSTSDIQLVQNLIERCLQMYMSQKEVVSTLQSQAKIEPGFTGLVWQVSDCAFVEQHYSRQNAAHAMVPNIFTMSLH